MNRARLRAVLFDAAGTLIELKEPVGETYARVARRHGACVPAGRLEDGFRRIFAAAPAMVFPGAPPAEAALRERAWWREVVRGTFRAADQQEELSDFEACFAELWRHYGSPGAWRARPGAAAVLRTLRSRGLALAILSNFDQRLPPLLAALGLAAELDAVVLPAHAGVAKPDRRIFEHALTRLGVPAAEAVYVGDDADADLAGAHGAGLAAIDVKSLATLEALPSRLEAGALEIPS
ncbi:MAG: HAD-IA family hydrolase [Myxococcota bacterium]